MGTQLNNIRIALRHDTLQNWESANTILLNGEIAIVSCDNSTRLKVGDGLAHFNDLPFLDDSNVKLSSEQEQDIKSDIQVDGQILVDGEVQANGLTVPSDESIKLDETTLKDYVDSKISADANATSIAPIFDNTKTYEVDEVVMYEKQLYRCTTKVETPGEWTGSSNWAATNATNGDTAFIKDDQGHLVVREIDEHGSMSSNSLYVDAYRLASDTTTHTIKDASINEIGEIEDGAIISLPPAIVGHSRDFVVEMKIGAAVPSFTFPLAQDNLKPYSDVIPQWAENTTYCISFTEFPDGKWRIGCARRGCIKPPYLRRVAYLETTGTQWVDTGVSPTPLTTVIIHGNFISAIHGDHICGTRTGTSNNNRFFVASGGYFYRSTMGSKQIVDHSVGYDRLNHTIVYNRIPGNIWSFDDKTYDLSDNDYVNSDSSKNLIISGVSGYGDIQACAECIFYGLEILENNVYVRKYIPVIDFNECPCFYDEVSGQLFYNQGTGEFTWGEL